MKALSVKQPWAWAIMHGGKDVENRDWPTTFRGVIAIHASKVFTQDNYDALYFAARYEPGFGDVWRTMPDKKTLVCGAILGTVEIVDCVKRSPSPWFSGEFGFVLRNPCPLPEPVPYKGALGLWHLPDAVILQAEEKR